MSAPSSRSTSSSRQQTGTLSDLESLPVYTDSYRRDEPDVPARVLLHPRRFAELQLMLARARLGMGEPTPYKIHDKVDRRGRRMVQRGFEAEEKEAAAEAGQGGPSVEETRAASRAIRHCMREMAGQPLDPQVRRSSAPYPLRTKKHKKREQRVQEEPGVRLIRRRKGQQHDFGYFSTHNAERELSGAALRQRDEQRRARQAARDKQLERRRRAGAGGDAPLPGAIMSLLSSLDDRDATQTSLEACYELKICHNLPQTPVSEEPPVLYPLSLKNANCWMRFDVEEGCGGTVTRFTLEDNTSFLTLGIYTRVGALYSLAITRDSVRCYAQSRGVRTLVGERRVTLPRTRKLQEVFLKHTASALEVLVAGVAPIRLPGAVAARALVALLSGSGQLHLIEEWRLEKEDVEWAVWRAVCRTREAVFHRRQLIAAFNAAAFFENTQHKTSVALETCVGEKWQEDVEKRALLVAAGENISRTLAALAPARHVRSVQAVYQRLEPLSTSTFALLATLDEETNKELRRQFYRERLHETGRDLHGLEKWTRQVPHAADDIDEKWCDEARVFAWLRAQPWKFHQLPLIITDKLGNIDKARVEAAMQGLADKMLLECELRGGEVMARRSPRFDQYMVHPRGHLMFADERRRRLPCDIRH